MNKKKVVLDEEEKDMLSEVENGSYKSMEDEPIKAQKIRDSARSYTKDKNINLRLSSDTLEKLKLKSEEKGIPYQTLASSILYQYANGDLDVRL